MCCLDAPVVTVEEGRGEYHPKLKQTNLTIACNVTADPAPDVNWARGRTVLSKYDSKVGESCVVSLCPHCVLTVSCRTNMR